MKNEKNIEKIRVIDFETTGLVAGIDEVLQVSIIDENFNTLLDTYCKPLKNKEWINAQQIHGITPFKVKDSLPFEEYVENVKKLLKSADKIIAYNVNFENSFLEAYGIKVPLEKWIDPMEMFAEIYGEWNEYRGCYKWQSLVKCADYYGFEFKAHNSLEDTKATLYCYKKMINI